jgi:integrase
MSAGRLAGMPHEMANSTLASYGAWHAPSRRERARKRSLDDQEIRDVWKALDAADVPACFSTCVRILLLTGQRCEEVSRMNWQEIQGDIWTIPAARADKQGHKTSDVAGAKVVRLSSTMSPLLGKPKRKGL